MNFRPLLGTLLGLLLTLPANAAEVRVQPKAVLELFTSQGCVSCPPADALLARLAQRPDVIALSYHVDYWDYIGWTDTFGASNNTARQKDYANRWGSNRIYTPQMVVNGAKGVVGSRQKEIDSAVNATRLTLPVALSAGDGMLSIDIEGQAGLSDSVVWLVTYLDKADVAIEKGENEGKRVTYTNIVTGRQAVGMWEPGAGAHLKLPLSEVLTGKSNGAVVIVQEEHDGLPGPILGAAAFSQ